MTNKGERPEELQLADMLALTVVSEVIDEAHIIVTAALASGAPWSYLEMVRNLRNDIRLDQTLIDDMTYVAKQSVECSGNVTTSTPQKSSGKSSSPIIDSAYIGQGDENVYLQQDDLRNCTSTFINNLFDMSDVERVITCDGPEYSIQDYTDKASDPNDMLQQALTKIANAFMNDTLIPDSDHLLYSYEPPRVEELLENPLEYSILDDAYAANVFTQDADFYIHDDTSNNIKGFDSTQVPIIETVTEEGPLVKEVIENNNIAYENAFLSLNRDYEQLSEEGYMVIEDPTSLNLQEVELINNTDTNLSPRIESEVKKELISESSVFPEASGSRKSLVRRCRLQGARILARLRGWWRRKAHNRRKEYRSGSARGICPLSPGMRSRTASLIAERKLGSPPTTKHVRKFNTISEAVIKSCIWKDYSFEVKSKTS